MTKRYLPPPTPLSFSLGELWQNKVGRGEWEKPCRTDWNPPGPSWPWEAMQRETDLTGTSVTATWALPSCEAGPGTLSPGAGPEGFAWRPCPSLLPWPLPCPAFCSSRLPAHPQGGKTARSHMMWGERRGAQPGACPHASRSCLSASACWRSQG